MENILECGMKKMILSDHPFRYEIIICLGLALIYLISPILFMYNLPWGIPIIPFKYYENFRKLLYGKDDITPTISFMSA